MNKIGPLTYTTSPSEQITLTFILSRPNLQVQLSDNAGPFQSAADAFAFEMGAGVGATRQIRVSVTGVDGDSCGVLVHGQTGLPDFDAVVITLIPAELRHYNFSVV